MKDITVILVGYPSQVALNKAFISLEKISSRLHAVLIFQEPGIPLTQVPSLKGGVQPQFVTVKHNDLGALLNHTVGSIHTAYLLFLSGTDYLSPMSRSDALFLSESKDVLATTYHQHQQVIIQKPFIVRTECLKKHRFFSKGQLPFKEAIFPAWLSTIDYSTISFQRDMLKQSVINRSTDNLERQKMIEKYPLKKVKTDAPTLSVIISNYNMENYVETALVSCLLQSEQPDQVLMMDDGSTDQSYKRIKEWNREGRVKVFQQKNAGKARALNALLPHVTSDFILELDADDWLDPDAVSVIKKYLKNLAEDVAVLYGNLKKWKQQKEGVIYKNVAKGKPVKTKADLLGYRFPLGPRIYRTACLKAIGGFPVTAFKDGRLYEDVSVLIQLIQHYPFSYQDFTVYHVREHQGSITKNHLNHWKDFLETLR